MLDNAEEIGTSILALTIEIKNNCSQEIAENLFTELLTLLIGKTVLDKEQPANIEKAKDFIKANFKRNILVEEIAQKVFLSKYHLIRQFKKETGLSPHQFQIQLRLNDARSRLLNNEPFSKIAFDLGFADDAHFIRTFKRYASYSPKKYQAELSNFLLFFSDK